MLELQQVLVEAQSGLGLGVQRKRTGWVELVCLQRLEAAQAAGLEAAQLQLLLQVMGQGQGGGFLSQEDLGPGKVLGGTLRQ